MRVLAGLQTHVGTLGRPLFGSEFRPATSVTAQPRPRECKTPAAARSDAVDVVRLLAATAVVLLHSLRSTETVGWSSLLRFAVPFYLFASLYFLARSLERRPGWTLRSLTASRLRRLYVPFAAWSVIYFALRNVKRIVVLRSGPPDMGVSLAWTGAQYHLWFLPFLLTTTILLGLILRAIGDGERRHRRCRIAIGLALLAGLTLSAIPVGSFWTESFDQSGYTYSHWLAAAPAACGAIAFALYASVLAPATTIPPVIGFAGIILTVSCCANEALSGDRVRLVPRALAGFGAMLAALAPWNGPIVAALARLGRYSFGVYLTHVLFVESLHVGLAKCHVAPGAAADLLVFAASFAGSLCLTRLITRSSRLVWLVA